MYVSLYEYGLLSKSVSIPDSDIEKMLKRAENDINSLTFNRIRKIGFDKAMAKYLYISDTTIKGHATNDDTGTNSAMNINYQNSLYVLRYVLGV